MKLVYFILIFLPLAYRLVYDYYHIEVLKTGINYIRHNLLTFILMVFVSIVVPAGFVAAMTAQISFYIGLFSYALNFFRGKPVFRYLGDPNDYENMSVTEFIIHYYGISWKTLLVIRAVFVVIGLVIVLRFIF